VAKPLSGSSDPSNSRSKKAALREFLMESGLCRVDETAARDLENRFGPFTSSYLRRTLREVADELQIKLSPLVEGIRQDGFESLERTLRAMGEHYAARPESRQECRRLVIESKEHAQFAERRFDRDGDAEARDVKREMILWMRVWLDDPALFGTWLELRRREKGRAIAPGD
jgi:hypothetical protein